MPNKEQILKNLLKSLLEERIQRLEKRNSEQIKDIEFEKDSYKNQSILITKLCSIEHNQEKKLIKSKTYDKLVKKEMSKTPLRKNIIILNEKKPTKIISKTPEIILRKNKKDKTDKKNEGEPKNSKTLIESKNSQNAKNSKISSTNNKKIPIKENKTNINNNKPKYKDIIKKNMSPVPKENNSKKSFINSNLKETDLKPENPKIFLDTNNNFDIIISNNKLLTIILDYLDEETQYNFLSCNKKFLKFLNDKLDNIYNMIREKNGISESSTIENKINSLKLKYNEELNKEMPKLSLSKRAIKALELLNNDTYISIFKNKELIPPLDEIIIIYRIFFQLLKGNNFNKIKNNKKFWDKAGEYILSKNKGKLGEFFNGCIEHFDFGIQNIYEIKKIVSGNEDKIKPIVFSNLCGTTGLFIFLIKDVLEYLGIIDNFNKNNPKIILQYLEYINTKLNKVQKYIHKIKNINHDI